MTLPISLAAIYQRRATPTPQHDYTTGLRQHQIQPAGDWLYWLIMAGRGWGKTHTGAHWILQQAMRVVGDYAVIAPTFKDVRKVCVEGPSGILKTAAPGHVVAYNKGNGVLTLANGSLIHTLSADQPDRIRGYNLSGAWCDEVATWRYDASWYDGLIPALRIGERPRVVITTTPRSTKLMRDLAGRTEGDTVAFTRGSTWDNSDNLSAAILTEFRRWEGTTRGRQELHGELLDDMPGANWRRPWIERSRVDKAPDLIRIVIGVDPAGSANTGTGSSKKGASDETGIVVAGVDRMGDFYVLDDKSLTASPDGWARQAVHCFDEHAADRIVAEKNFGGDMVEATLRNVRSDVPLRMVTASKGKAIRAEPIAALYEQRKVHHVGAFPDLEDQMCTWEPASSYSPDRMDALVWALTELSGVNPASAWIEAMHRRMGR